MPNTLINVSNRLPVTVEEDRVTKSSGGLVAALEGLPEEQYKTSQRYLKFSDVSPFPVGSLVGRVQPS